MTPKRLRVLVFINLYCEANGFTPTYADIAEHMELASLATVHKHIIRLVADGYLLMFRNRKRSMELTERGIVACGRKRSDTILINRVKKYGDALIQIAEGLTTDLTSKHIARVALGWEN